MKRGYGYKHHQNSYAMHEESQQQSSYAMHQQQAWNSNSQYQGHVLGGGHVPPAACFVDSQAHLLKNQARVEGGLGAKRHDGWHSQNMHHQTGRVHGSGASGFGKRVPKEFGTDCYNNSSQFSNAAMFDMDNGMRRTEFEKFEEVCAPAGGAAVRMKEKRYEKSSWGARDDDDNYQHCFDNGAANWGGHQRFEWTAKGV